LLSQSLHISTTREEEEFSSQQDFEKDKKEDKWARIKATIAIKDAGERTDGEGVLKVWREVQETRLVLDGMFFTALIHARQNCGLHSYLEEVLGAIERGKIKKDFTLQSKIKQCWGTKATKKRRLIGPE